MLDKLTLGFLLDALLEVDTLHELVDDHLRVDRALVELLPPLLLLHGPEEPRVGAPLAQVPARDASGYVMRKKAFWQQGKVRTMLLISTKDSN